MESLIRQYVEANRGELFPLLHDLCVIPAPSHQEEKRAEFCKKWLESIGAEGVYIDDSGKAKFFDWMSFDSEASAKAWLKTKAGIT